MTIEDRRGQRTRTERRRVALPLALVWVAGLVVIVGVAARDPGRSAPALIDSSGGLVSILAIAAWTVAVVAAAAGAWVCGLGGRGSARRLLLTGALLSALFLTEDLLQLHSPVLPDLTGRSAGVIEALSALVALRWMSQYRHELRRTHRFVIAASVAALGLSVLVDLLAAPRPGEPIWWVEDGARLLGALAWATYFVVTAAGICRSVFTDALLTWPDEAYDAAFGDGAFASDAAPASAVNRRRDGG